MLEQLLVQLEYPYTANCGNCSSILFEIRIIDQFLKVIPHQKGERLSKDKDAAKFYMLHSEILPSSIFVQKSSFLSQQKPFHMQFLGEVKCGFCKERIGIKILTVSSEFHYPELLDRHLIDVNKVRIKTQKEDVTSQLLQRFYQQWDNETEIDQIQLPQNLKPIKGEEKRQQLENYPKKQKGKEQRKEENKKERKNQTNASRDRISKQEQQIKYLRKQLEQENEQNKEIVQEIVASIDFFNQVLASLQKRVAQTENVCNVLKQKVEKMMPLLRKKNQQ